MTDASVAALARLLCGEELRIRTGILLLGGSWLGREGELGARLNIGYQDLGQRTLEGVPSGRRFLGNTQNRLIADLSAVLADPRVPGRCVLVSNVDLFLAGLPPADHHRFWDFMRVTFRRARGLMLSFPSVATHLLPLGERDRWEEVGRIVVWEGRE